jgi:hypothetical protein
MQRRGHYPEYLFTPFLSIRLEGFSVLDMFLWLINSSAGINEDDDRQPLGSGNNRKEQKR